MSDAFLVRRGGSGGLSPNSAVIHVTATAGSTITFAKGGVTVKVLGPDKSHVNSDDSTLAYWYYAVSPGNYGAWTVTATLGQDTAVDVVTISENKQYDVELSFELYIIKNGTTSYEWKLLSGMKMTQNASSVVFQGKTGGYHVGVVDGLFDVTRYNLLIADVTFSVVDNGSYYALWDANVETPTKDNTSAIKYADSSGHLELDISGLSGSMKIGVGTVYTNVCTYTSLYLMQ